MIYDIIGDIHGHADALEGLLAVLGYSRRRGGSGYAHPDPHRMAIFVGDLVDRGPHIPRTIRIVRRMLDSGTAYMVMGNHEYNLIGYHTLRHDRPHAYVRARSEPHMRQCRETLRQYAHSPAELHDVLDWMKSLPLYLDFPQLRIVHAAWQPQAAATVQQYAPDTHHLSESLLQDSAVYGTPAFYAVEQLLKGVEINLPEGVTYRDKEGTERTRSRVAWWFTPDARPVTLGNLLFPPGVVPDQEIIHTPISPKEMQHVPGYRDGIPVFVGHYWLTGTPSVINSRICCVDYSIAAGGLLAAYTFSGESELQNTNFTCVDAAGNLQ